MIINTLLNAKIFYYAYRNLGELIMESKSEAAIPSRINPKYIITPEKWVISVMNTGSILGGHSVMVIEGIGQYSERVGLFGNGFFVNQYDIRAIVFESGSSSASNCKGIISEVRCFEGNEHTRDYSKFPAKSHYCDPNRAKEMIYSIHQDKQKVESFMKEIHNIENIETKEAQQERLAALLSSEDKYLKYQTRGAHGILTKISDGDNCAGWCNEKLAIAGIGDGTQLPKPKIAAGQCVIL